MNNLETFLDISFEKAAKNRLKMQKEKIYSYKLFSGFMGDQLEATGKCKVRERRYERSIDCDILVCEDLDTGKVFSANQFAVILKEIKEGK